MSILIASKGWLSTVQDLGRPGYAQYGINRSGAMDPLALQAANALLGNLAPTAALEMCFPAPALFFQAPALITLSGADFGAKIGDRALPRYTPIWVDAGTELQFQHKYWGQYAYLSIQGGLDIAPWLNSQSTNLKAQSGGWQGRALQKGDVIPLQKTFLEQIGQGLKIAKYHTRLDRFYAPTTPIRFIPGQHYAQLLPHSREQLLTQSWRIGNASDRMGYRLEGEGLQLSTQDSLLSAGLTRGSIQLPPNGQPIVLMADHQTTGGYPLLGQVIQADWPRLAQLGPGDRFQSQAVGMQEAVELYRAELEFLGRLRVGSRHALVAFF
ncbi:biotin-dependent carboxyltransferase family protein [Haliscomenobacter sp.]|uniref:5-oxoprolinase subunit C family protein n=1 Tax=Haliscomenobacter sp. TaxID=2717303 RepID=UPI00336514CB